MCLVVWIEKIIPSVKTHFVIVPVMMVQIIGEVALEARDGNSLCAYSM